MTDHSPTNSHTQQKSLDDIRDTYAEHADTMASMDWFNRLLTGRFRRRFFGRAQGRVLDVACGVGTNLEYLPEQVDYVGVDLSPDMLAHAAERYARLEPGVNLFEMDAQALEFDDDSFDTVISAMSTCTFPDPTAALGEMSRVCEPDGRILLVEHGKSEFGPLASFQDWRAEAHFEKHACRWNQEPLELVAQAGLRIRDAATRLLGALTAIEAEPAGERH